MQISNFISDQNVPGVVVGGDEILKDAKISQKAARISIFSQPLNAFAFPNYR